MNPPIRQSSLIISNAAIIWVSRALQLIPQLILIPFLLSTLGEAGYGIYVLVWTLMVSVDLVEQSLQTGVVKYSAAFLANDRIDEVNKVVSSSFFYSLFLGVVASGGIALLSTMPGILAGGLETSLIVLSITVLVVTPLIPYVGVIQARQHYYVGAIANTAGKYAGLLAVVVWFSLASPSVEAIVIIMASMLFLSRAVQVPIAYRLVRGLRNRARAFDFGSLRMIAAFGTMTVVMALCLSINSTGVRWLMGAMVSSGFVAHLAIILMPGMLLAQIINPVTVTVMPATSAYEAKGDHKTLKELFIRGTRYTTILVLASLIPAALLMPDALRVWVGPEYVSLAPYAIILFASESFALSTATGHHMLKGLGKLRTSASIAVIGLVAVPIPLILLVYLGWGDPYIAVTLGLAAGHFVTGSFQAAFGIKAVGIDWRKFLFSAYIRTGMVAAIVFGAAFAFAKIGQFEGLSGNILVALIAVGSFLWAIHKFVATHAERAQVRQWRRKVFSGIGRAPT